MAAGKAQPWSPSLAAVAALAAAAAAVYVATDPLEQGAMVRFPGFETHLIDLPGWSELPAERDEEDRLQRADVRWTGEVQGPESIAFDPSGTGPYVGVADGRVLFWNGSAWLHFAHASPHRSEICRPKPSMLSYLKHEHICGRPLGLRFCRKTGALYFADAYFGLMKVGPEGGLATSVTDSGEGVPIGFANDLDIDEQGNVYFTDSSRNYQRRDFLQLLFTSEPTGRLLKYDVVTKETSVLVHDLQFPNGISLSKDESFLVFCEGSLGRLTRYWLKGEKAGTTEPFAILPGFPDNVRTNEQGDFWVAIHARRGLYGHFFALHPHIRKFLLKLPIPAKYHYILSVGGKLHAQIIKYSPNGKVLQVLEDRQGKVVKAVSEVIEKDGELWLGSVIMQFLAVYKP